MFEVKIVAADAAELVMQIDALRAAVVGSGEAAPIQALSGEKPAPKKSNRSAKQDTAASSDQASAQGNTPANSGSGPTAPTDASPSEPAAETPADEAITYKDVQKAVNALALAKGRDAVLAVFETFGVDHGSKLTEAQWPEAVQALTDALDG